MLTRTIEVNLQHETKPAFFKKFKAEVLPILKKAAGFFDIVVLENNIEPNKIVTLSFWGPRRMLNAMRKSGTRR